MSSVPPGGLILVTGANSYVASVAIHVFLKRGYRVRGSVRSAHVNSWMKGHFGPGFELVEIQDINRVGAIDQAIHGVQGIVHMAANTDMDATNQAIIDTTIRCNLDILEAASKEKSVKSVVFTSSSAACATPTTGQPYEVNSSSWNTSAINDTINPWNGEGNPRSHAIKLYAAAKARGEQEAFAWVARNKPNFSFNTVVASVNWGIAISPENLGYRTTSAVIDAVVKGYPSAPLILPSQWYVDVEDTALLHLGALTLVGVTNERLLAYAGRYTWKDILRILQERFPGQVKLTETEELVVDAGKVDNARAAEVLKMMGKEDGFTSLTETLAKAVNTILSNQGKDIPKSKIDLYYDALNTKGN